MKGPLTGLRIVDFTWVVAGPFCTKTFADMGAEVIKIEARNRPDGMRGYVNRYTALENPFPYGSFDMFNRNKMGITVNSRHPEGLALLKDLIGVGDVVAENFRGGVLERWGLTYDVMRAARADVIYMSLSGYGQSGPYSSYASHFHMAQALPGFTHLTGYEGDVPVATGSWGDTTAGLHAAVALSAALEHRNRTGAGQHIDVTQLTAMASVMGTAYLEYTANGAEAGPGGNVLPHTSSFVEGAFRCQGEERWVAIGVHTEDEWRALCGAIGASSLITDPRFAAASDRIGNRSALEDVVERWTLQRTAEAAMATLQDAGIEAAVVENIQDMMERDEQLVHRGYYVDAKHPDESVGTLRMDGVVPKFSDTPGEVWRAAPTIGEHNEYVFGELLGLSTKRVSELQEAGVFF